MAASAIRPDSSSHEWGTRALTLRSLCDLSLGSLPLRSPPHLVKLTAHSVHDALSLALSSALSELSHHHSWERKKKHAEERSRVQADPPPSTETMLPSLRKDRIQSHCLRPDHIRAPRVSCHGENFMRFLQTTWLDKTGLSPPISLGSKSGRGPGSLQFFTFDNNFIEI